MSGAADDDSAPSNSTPQSPEGAEGAPDVTVAESKPDTPSSHAEEDGTPRSESKNETPTEQPSETGEPAKEEALEPAKEENDVSTNESKTEVGDRSGDAEEPQPEDGGGQNNSEEGPAPAIEDRKSDPAPETCETELVQQDDAKPSGEDNEATSKENESGNSDDSKQVEEPRKGDGETEGAAVTDESAKDEGGSENKTEAENECNDFTKPDAEESVNTNANNDVAGGTPQNAEAEASKDVPESDTQKKPNEGDNTEGDNIPEAEVPMVDAPNTESLGNEDAPLESVENKQGESAENNPRVNEQDNGATAAPSNPTENANVELSELDSLKLENENLGKRLKELEGEIERIREGRKEGMKIQADYLARELSQQQDTEKYLREKLAEVLQEKEESERRVKDLQLRLKRFAKDDQAKDARLAKMEKELREVTHEIQILENMLDADTLRSLQEQRAKGNVNGPSGTGTETNKGTTQHPPPPQSKTCIIL